MGDCSGYANRNCFLHRRGHSDVRGDGSRIRPVTIDGHTKNPRLRIVDDEPPARGERGDRIVSEQCDRGRFGGMNEEQEIVSEECILIFLFERSLYMAHRDDNLFRLLGAYNYFLEQLSDGTARSKLAELEYSDRYSRSAFSSLKANSDAFSAEITRFINARRGQWSDRFFEYLLL